MRRRWERPWGKVEAGETKSGQFFFWRNQSLEKWVWSSWRSPILALESWGENGSFSPSPSIADFQRKLGWEATADAAQQLEQLGFCFWRQGVSMDCCQQLGDIGGVGDGHLKYHHSVIFLNLHLPRFRLVSRWWHEYGWWHSRVKPDDKPKKPEHDLYSIIYKEKAPGRKNYRQLWNLTIHMASLTCFVIAPFYEVKSPSKIPWM